MAPKKKANPYIIFVHEWQIRNGEHSFEAAIQKAAKEWESLPEEEKNWYKEEARLRRIGSKGKPLNITPSSPPSNLPSSSVEGRSNERLSVKEKLQDSDVRNQLVDAFCSKPIPELLNTDIYIVSFNVSVRTKDNVYIPIEVGIVKFNLAKGIRATHHEFIDGGRIPVGHGYEIKDHMERIHRLPLYDISEYPVVEEVATTNPVDHLVSVTKSIEAIENFIQTDRISVQNVNPDVEATSYKPVFTLPDLDGLGLEQTDGCFRRMSIEGKNSKFYEDYAVLDLTYLLFMITKRSGGAVRPLASCADLLNRQVHSYVNGTNCMFHETTEVPHCALARSYRFSYCMLDTLVPLFKVEVAADHVPEPRAVPVAHAFGLLPPTLQRTNDRSTKTAKAKGTYWSDI